jgi:outer membrane protein assembly factor BamB
MRHRFAWFGLRVVILVALQAPIASALADDWPQWRGPNRDGVWRETGVINRFESDQIPLKWRVPISSGYSGPTVAAGRVYVTDRVVEPKQIERVHCFDADTGKPLWTHAYDCVYSGVGYDAGPRASVTLDGDRAYALGTMGHLFCLDAATGSVRWQRDMNQDYKIRMPIWGIASAPLVYDDLLIVQIGGEADACLVALDKHSGEERWRALDDRPSYAAPILFQQAGQDVLICWTGDNVVGLDPRRGAVHWRHEFKPTRMVIAIATPVIDNHRLFVSSFYDGSLMLALDPNKLAAQPVWRKLGRDEQHTESLHSIISTPLIDGDHVYGIDSYGELRCLDAQTGERIWESLDAVPKNRWATIHMVRHGEDIWMFNEKGELLIARLTPQGFHEISRSKLIEPTTIQLNRRGQGVCWAHPAYANRHVFARNDEELVCASLSAD